MELYEKGTPSILNIAAGKFDPIDIDKCESCFLVNLDIMYSWDTTIEDVEKAHHEWLYQPTIKHKAYLNYDAFRFMQRYSNYFDVITVYRFLEHVKRSDLLFFIYLMSTTMKIGGFVDCIVPNYETLAEMILDENVGGVEWEAHDIIVTTELLNEPPDSHASIWTPNRAKRYFELEERFKIVEMDPSFKFDGRDIYMRIIAERIEKV